MPSGSMHWFSMLSSVLAMLFMGVLVAVILMRTVRRDLAKYEELLIEGKDSSKEDSGWKLLSGYVFRPPAKRQGVQLPRCSSNSSALLGRRVQTASRTSWQHISKK
jgi:hypothetical protein